jgi:hypothetical protein
MRVLASAHPRAMRSRRAAKSVRVTYADTLGKMAGRTDHRPAILITRLQVPSPQVYAAFGQVVMFWSAS